MQFFHSRILYFKFLLLLLRQKQITCCFTHETSSTPRQTPFLTRPKPYLIFMEMRDMSLEAAKAENDVTPTPAPEAAATASAENNPGNVDPTVLKEDEAVEAEADMDSFPEEVAEIARETENEPADNTDGEPRHESRQNTPASKEEILQTLTALAEDESADISREELSRLKQHFYAFRKTETEAELAEHIAQGKPEAEFTPSVNEAEEQFKTLMNTLKDRKAAQAAALEEERARNLEQKKALIKELTEISADTDNVNKAFPRVKEIQETFKTIGEVPPTDATDIWKSYQGAVEQFYDQLKVNKDLRDYDFRKNLELKTLLCEEAVKLQEEDDVILAFKRLQNLHDEWRQIGPVAKDVREEIWARFKDSSAVINKKYQTFFEERKARETENEAAKTAICEQVEALDFASLNSFAAWDAMTRTILDAQQKWSKIGFAPRKSNNALFARFRAICDKFFAAKAEYYRSVKDELAANLAKKIALCEKAEALRDSTDWRKTADTLVELQKEWKTIGAVAKKHSDNVWHRFQKACDTFFENRKKNLSESRSGEQANLKAKRDIIAQLKAIPADTPRSEAMPKVKELQAQWQSIGHVPFREKDKLYEEYRAVCDAFYARSRDNRGSMSRFEDVIEEMGSDAAKLRRERERILRAFEIKRNELKTYENNLGFLSSKSKSGDSMVREMERRIQRIKDDLAAIEQKVRLIDSKL